MQEIEFYDLILCPKCPWFVADVTVDPEAGQVDVFVEDPRNASFDCPECGGYSLQANRKTVEGKQHPDRDSQFEFIARRVKRQRKRGEPSISVDTKKKEVLGNLKNSGRTYRPSKQPLEVETHDFPKPKLGKAIP